MSELSLSWGSDELQILVIDSDDWPCSSTCVWVLNKFSICGRDIFYNWDRKRGGRTFSIKKEEEDLLPVLVVGFLPSVGLPVLKE